MNKLDKLIEKYQKRITLLKCVPLTHIGNLREKEKDLLMQFLQDLEKLKKGMKKKKYVPYQKCPICDGSGTITELQLPTIKMDAECPTCEGKRIIPAHVGITLPDNTGADYGFIKKGESDDWQFSKPKDVNDIEVNGEETVKGNAHWGSVPEAVVLDPWEALDARLKRAAQSAQDALEMSRKMRKK